MPFNEPLTTPCNLCGSTTVSVLSRRSRSGAPLRTVICQHCGLAWTDPPPQALSQFYEKDYRIIYKGTYSPKPKHVLRAGLVALSRYRKIEKYLTEPRRVLDVGSGGGEFAYLLKRAGHEVCGIEPNRGYAAYSISQYGLDVHMGFIQEQQQIPHESFGLITIWHVLEHTDNPFHVLQGLYSLLKPEGFLVIEVPNIEATCQSPNSTFHEAHLFHFNILTLSKLAQKAGFSVSEHSVSEDGGNIMLIAKKSTAPHPEHLQIQGNSDKIKDRVANRSTLRHYLSSHPYSRLYHKVCRHLHEARHVRRFSSGKEILNHLYAPVDSTRP